MSAVLKDPKVLSVLEKKRGNRGYRELQGENLRKLLFQLVTKQVTEGIAAHSLGKDSIYWSFFSH